MCRSALAELFADTDMVMLIVEARLRLGISDLLFVVNPAEQRHHICFNCFALFRTCKTTAASLTEPIKRELHAFVAVHASHPRGVNWTCALDRMNYRFGDAEAHFARISAMDGILGRFRRLQSIGACHCAGPHCERGRRLACYGPSESKGPSIYPLHESARIVAHANHVPVTVVLATQRRQGIRRGAKQRILYRYTLRNKALLRTHKVEVAELDVVRLFVSPDGLRTVALVRWSFRHRTPGTAARCGIGARRCLSSLP